MKRLTGFARHLAFAAVLVTVLGVGQEVRAAIETTATLRWSTFDYSCTSGCTLTLSNQSDSTFAWVFTPTSLDSDGPNSVSDWSSGVSATAGITGVGTATGATDASTVSATGSLSAQGYASANAIRNATVTADGAGRARFEVEFELTQTFDPGATFPDDTDSCVELQVFDDVSGFAQGEFADMANSSADLPEGGTVTQTGLLVLEFDMQDDQSLGFLGEAGTEMTIVPVPAAVWLLGSGLVAFGAIARRRERTA